MILDTGSLTCEIPTDKTRTGWVFDRTSIEAAIQEMGIRYFVSIGFSSGYWKVGSHRIKRIRNRKEQLFIVNHRIIVSQNRQLDEANETLWHELRHAQQAEEWARQGEGYIPPEILILFYRDAYKKAKGPHGASYKENRFEIDCRDFARAKVRDNRYLLKGKYHD